MKIKFIHEYRTKAVNGPFYKVGDILDCSAETANHFKYRGVAVDYTEPAKTDSAYRLGSEPDAGAGGTGKKKTRKKRSKRVGHKRQLPTGPLG